MGMLNLSAFNLRSIQDLITAITLAKRSGIVSLDELNTVANKAVYDRISKKTNPITPRKIDDVGTKIRCKLCKQFLMILPVNNKPSTQVGGGYNSCTICHNPKCKDVVYYTETVQELIERVK